jgi:hypothetical protein
MTIIQCHVCGQTFFPTQSIANGLATFDPLACARCNDFARKNTNPSSPKEMTERANLLVSFERLKAALYRKPIHVFETMTTPEPKNSWKEIERNAINPIVGYLFHSGWQLGSVQAPHSVGLEYLREGTSRIREVLARQIAEAERRTKERIAKTIDGMQFVQPAQAGQFGLHASGYNEAIEDILASLHQDPNTNHDEKIIGGASHMQQPSAKYVMPATPSPYNIEETLKRFDRFDPGKGLLTTYTHIDHERHRQFLHAALEEACDAGRELGYESAVSTAKDSLESYRVQLRKEIEGQTAEYLHPEFCAASGPQFKRCTRCVLQDVLSLSLLQPPTNKP